jgi:hypothetical protein
MIESWYLARVEASAKASVLEWIKSIIDLTYVFHPTSDLFDRLKRTSLRKGISMAELVRQQLECLQSEENRTPRFLSHAGAIGKPRDLSSRKGFSYI